eukprot:CAMPEP_0202463458 /NCGR_PEP_ID=MMETSP1360-20130828/58254_1 /ASSEMBLY_ACC=CAM_ASM_000848 /TAXON_ID=515479 /ORGANISM="Licmophora paradoxa, Strain CCMP2313" /LENGTH=118 /DNA_ID=CAMNT_0049086375 /DNA_START=11 /DNA_END=364 /DNA_ORIENTATION=-
MTTAVAKLSVPVETPPTVPGDQSNVAQMELWKLQTKAHFNMMQSYANFQTWFHRVMIGQCTPAMKEQIRSHPEYDSIGRDGIALLKIIKSIMHSFEPGRESPVHSMMTLKEQFYTIKQ